MKVTADIRQARDGADFDAALAIREEVFIAEQDVTIEEEIDGLDPIAFHVLAWCDGKAVGTGRAVPPRGPGTGGGAYHLGRIAVREGWRRRGLGSAIVRALEELCLRDAAARGGCGQAEGELSAQTNALDFYLRLGYTVYGREYLDARIEHRDAARWVRCPDADRSPT